MKNVGLISPYEFPSQIQSGEQCAVFRAGSQLCFEFSREVCDRGTPAALMHALMNAISREGKDPFVTQLGDVMARVFERASQVQQKAVQILEQSGWENQPRWFRALFV